MTRRASRRSGAWGRVARAVSLAEARACPPSRPSSEEVSEVSRRAKFRALAAAAVVAMLSGCWVAELRRCRDIDDAICDSDRLGQPPPLYVAIDEAERVPYGPGALVHAWHRCDRFTWEQYGLNVLGGGGSSRFYEDGELIFSATSNVDPSQQCDQGYECGDATAARACTPYCLWWDYWAGTDQAELPPGDPGWCEDSPWKDFVFEG